MEPHYFPVFKKLLLEIEDGCRLSTKVLPLCDSTVLMDSLRDISHSENAIFQSIEEGLKSGDIGEALANNQISNKYANLLDGNAIVAYIAATLLFQIDENNKQTRNKMIKVDKEEFDIITSSTDTIPVIGNDADSLQKALIAYLKNVDLSDCVELLAQTLYGRTEEYGTKIEVLKICSDFLQQVNSLLDYNEKLSPSVNSFNTEEKKGTTLSMPEHSVIIGGKPPRSPFSRSPSPKLFARVDRACSPIPELYRIASDPVQMFSELSLSVPSSSPSPADAIAVAATASPASAQANEHASASAASAGAMVVLVDVAPAGSSSADAPASSATTAAALKATEAAPLQAPAPAAASNEDDLFEMLKSGSLDSMTRTTSETDFDDELRKVLGV